MPSPDSLELTLGQEGCATWQWHVLTQALADDGSSSSMDETQADAEKMCVSGTNDQR